MDGISLAASIIQIIDISSRVVTKSIDIYRSSDGQLIEHHEIDHVTKALSNSAGRIDQLIAKSTARTDAELEQEQLGAKCREIADELVEVLNRLNSSGRAGRWRSFRQALKATWKEDKIISLEKRLDRYRQQMIANIVETLRFHAEDSSRQQASILEGIADIRRRQDELGQPLEYYGTRFLRDLTSSSGRNADRDRWRRDVIGAIHRRRPRRPPARSRRQRLTQAADRATKYLIRSLAFDEIDDREFRITKAHAETFRWIYSDPTNTGGARPWASFRTFLEQDQNGLYWITGKPGSGKSTLMKYLMTNNRTFRHLGRWAPDGATTSSFYFWNSGNDIQMSVEGLLRTILFRCFQQLPKSVVGRVFPARMEVLELFGDDDTPWTLHELGAALRRLVLEICPDHKFFFFIDGLDEFSGDHSHLTDLILDLTSSAKNVKVCVASRPWVNFEDAFRGTPHLMLQHLTTNDIKRYIASEFRQSPGFLELKVREPSYAAELLAEIAQKAEGVFLWVHLVVKSLLVGMTNGDRIRDLRRRLNHTPSNLEELFKKMIGSMEPQYQQHASQIFQIHRASTKSPTLLALAMADLENRDELLQKRLWPVTDTQILMQCKAMKRKLYSRCKGLLEIESSQPTTSRDSDNEENIADNKLQYLHRTVKDYLEMPETWEWILAANEEPFDPCVALSKSYLLQLKMKQTNEIDHYKIWDLATWSIHYAKQSELNDGPVQIALLDELDRTATALTSPGQYQNDQEDHWTSGVLLDATGASFLYLMAMCGMHRYLRAKLTPDHPELQEYGDSKTPLLFAALEDYLFLHPYRDRKAIVLDSPCPNTVRVLLCKGANPDQPYRGRSARMLANSMSFGSRERGFREVLRLIYKYGPPPPASTSQQKDGSKPPSAKADNRAVSSGTLLTEENMSLLDPTIGEGPGDGLRACNGSVVDEDIDGRRRVRRSRRRHRFREHKLPQSE